MGASGGFARHVVAVFEHLARSAGGAGSATRLRRPRVWAAHQRDEPLLVLQRLDQERHARCPHAPQSVSDARADLGVGIAKGDAQSL
jgi:hypothetical protein